MIINTNPGAAMAARIHHPTDLPSASLLHREHPHERARCAFNSCPRQR